MKYFRLIYILPLWIFYFFLTIEERTRYSHGVGRGMHCTEIRRIGISEYEFFYDAGRKPFREFMTFKQFLQIHLTRFPK